MKYKYFIIFLRILLGFIFIISSISKLTDLNNFTDALIKYKILNESLVFVFTYLVPSLELILGTALVFNIKSELSAQFATLLLATFTALIVIKLFEGEEITCGCFGNLTQGKIDIMTVFRNIILMIIGVILTVFYKNRIPSKTNQKFILPNRFNVFFQSNL